MEIKYDSKKRVYNLNNVEYDKQTLIRLIESDVFSNLITKTPSTVDIDIQEDNYNAYGNGKNIMVFGGPGTGKSYYVNKVFSNNQFRTVFHDSYSNSDFVGQYKPIINNEGKILYSFVPGPFTQALITAFNKPSETINLIIEEINRGNVASIFGEIFNLLDRKEGVSEYPINVSEDLKLYLQSNIKDCFNSQIKQLIYSGKIIIPRNLNIISTLNTSDQNVGYVDSAFKRRWEPIFVDNDFDQCSYKSKNIAYLSNAITWETFAKIINNYMSNLQIEEDRHLGAFFIKETELDDLEMFCSKVLFYLWSDVFKYVKSRIFRSEIDSFSTLRRNFLDSKSIFNDSIDYELIGNINNDNSR